jgi:hypothetical protein
MSDVTRDALPARKTRRRPRGQKATIAAPAKPPAEKPRAPWEKREWAGQPLYVCRLCGKDTLDVGEIYDHMKRKHPRALAPGSL